MTSIFRGLAVLTLVCGILGVGAAADDDGKKAAALPDPKWLKAFVDQGEDEAALKGYLTPEGVKVDIVAEFPVVTNPVGMTFAEDGTLFVIEWRPDPKPIAEESFTITYKDGTTRTFAAAKKSVKDVVKVLRDTKGKGVYDQSEVILEEELPPASWHTTAGCTCPAGARSAATNWPSCLARRQQRRARRRRSRR